LCRVWGFIRSIWFARMIAKSIGKCQADDVMKSLHTILQSSDILHVRQPCQIFWAHSQCATYYPAQTVQNVIQKDAQLWKIKEKKICWKNNFEGSWSRTHNIGLTDSLYVLIASEMATQHAQHCSSLCSN
jgi:hypothetical protein